jgi:quercetin dioxygenase-like cupin family protein
MIADAYCDPTAANPLPGLSDLEESAMYVKSITDLPAARLPGVEHRTLAGSDDRLEQLSIWQQSLAPQARTPRHQHDCEEVIVVLSGAGELYIEGRVHEFCAGTTLVIPAGVTHEIRATGTTAVQLIAAFSKARAGVFDMDGVPIELPW